MTRRREPSLPELVRDTPVRPLKPLDVTLYRYSADLATLPPPPQSLEERRGAVLEKIRGKTASGSWDAEQLMGADRAWFEEVLAKRIAEERAAHDKERADKAEAELAATRKFWMTVLAGVLIGVIVGGITWTAVVIVEASHHQQEQRIP